MTLGEAIREKRIEKGMTQLELSQEMNVSRTFLADLERNRYAPSYNTLRKLAITLDLDVNFLLKNDGNTIHDKV